ncbi:MAG TPA: peptidylprolyl isomerase [Rhodocyclaceae bacterium]|nr:peptidylprolyl isomerase [Rhodocyclaceae bacterium]
MKRHFLIALSFLAIHPALALAQAARTRPVEADRIVAVVNSEAITLFELRSRLAMVERQLRGQNVQLPPREVIEKQLLERMIVDRAQMQFAKETGLQVTDGDVDAALRRIAESNRMALPDFRQALERDGVAWGKFREEVRQEITIARLRDREVDNRVTISEGEIDNYLDNTARPGGGEEVVQLAHIIVRVPEQANAQQLAGIRARAEQAAQQLQKGEDFGRVAASFSDAPDGLSGGVMEPRPTDRLPALYAEAVQTLKPGETSGILRSPAGFHIVRLLERRGGAMQVQALKQTHARHILIKVNELVSDTEAKHRLVTLKERLDNGGDFAELARLHSNDLSAAKGGDLGWLYQGDTVPDFEKAMDALKIGETSEPVRSPFGWHLIQVLERRTEDASKERRRLMARQALRERKSDEAYQEWLRQMRDRAYVESRLEDK